MFVIRRTFRSPSGLLEVGSVVEPSDVERFKTRLKDGLIVEVTEQNFERYKEFFKLRYSIDLPSLNTLVPTAVKPAKAAEPAKAVETAKVSVAAK